MKKIILLLLGLSFSIFSFSQITVTGNVTNDSIPLESASIIIRNSKKGVATNNKGYFKLEAKKGDTLSISYLGFETKEVIVDKNENLQVKLKLDNNLDEVLVIGYLSYCKISCTMRCIHLVERYTKQKQIKLYPNPSSNGIFQLKLIEDYSNVEMLVTNITGQTVQNSNYQKFGGKLTIDLSAVTTGIYIINIVADGKRLEPIKAIRT